MKPKTLILKTAGINCDEELAHGFRIAGADAEIIHINEFTRGGPSGQRSLLDFDIIGFPGGFAYGDDLSAGRVLATEFLAHLKDDLLAFHDKGGLVIGICNGFQALVKMRFLPDPDTLTENPDGRQEATLFWNDSGKFEDRWIAMRSEDTNCVWTKGIRGVVEFPIAHAEGKFIPVSDDALARLTDRKQIVFRYTDPESPDSCETGQLPYPVNPNGSTANIGGITDVTGRVLGMMPHPERYLYAENHPRQTRYRANGESREPDGLPLFRNAVEYVRG
jgi:phosphoribosylformylglycinamidine synthase